MTRLRLLSRRSDLAILQARLVADALRRQWPALHVELLTREASGDRDSRVALWAAADKGLFTADLSAALVAGQADLAVHSWKDLPLDSRSDTAVAGTLERADPRDVLLVSRSARDERPRDLQTLTSSPRRAWQLERGLARLLPWPVARVVPSPVRGNIPTRLGKLLAGEAHALVVAKAALDRLLSESSPASVRATVRAAVDRSAWMVLPVRDFPTAAAQGALAIEVASTRTDLLDIVRSVSDEPTRAAVEDERAILHAHGGGCHEALGITVLARDFGHVRSIRGLRPGGEPVEEWSLAPVAALPPLSEAAVWPRPAERHAAHRHSLPVTLPPQPRGVWITRADALPMGTTLDASRVVWTAGTQSWEKLAARGVWVHGCADGLGDGEPPAVNALAGEQIDWLRLTHTGADDERALATYSVDRPLPADLGTREAFFWTSGAVFLDALRRYPQIAGAWHASGPGRTARAIRHALPASSRVSIWLDYDQWHQHVTR
jgi:hydroxymethylbilane synthase